MSVQQYHYFLINVTSYRKLSQNNDTLFQDAKRALLGFRCPEFRSPLRPLFRYPLHYFLFHRVSPLLLLKLVYTFVLYYLEINSNYFQTDLAYQYLRLLCCDLCDVRYTRINFFPMAFSTTVRIQFCPFAFTDDICCLRSRSAQHKALATPTQTYTLGQTQLLNPLLCPKYVLQIVAHSLSEEQSPLNYFALKLIACVRYVGTLCQSNKMQL